VLASLVTLVQEFGTNASRTGLMLFKEVEASVLNNTSEISKATRKDTSIHLMSGGGVSNTFKSIFGFFPPQGCTM